VELSFDLKTLMLSPVRSSLPLHPTMLIPLARLSGIRHLVLADVFIPTIPSLLFPSLVSFAFLDTLPTSTSLDDEAAPHATPPFPKSSFPLLKALYTDKPELFLNVSSFQRLEMLQVPCQAALRYHKALEALPFPILVTCLRLLPISASPLFHHLQPDAYNPFDGFAVLQQDRTPVRESEVRGFAALRLYTVLMKLVTDGALRTLSLPAFSRLERLTSETAVETAKAFLASSTAAGIELSWRDSEEPADDVGVNKDFWMFAKEQEREKDEEW
jgi:hypothetical protein